MKNDQLIEVKRMNSNLFKAYVMFMREPFITFFSEELEYYTNEDSTIIGAIVFDFTDSDFNCVILCRDESEKFRCIDVQCSFETIDSARDWIIRKIRLLTLKEVVRFPQGNSQTGVNLFEVVIDKPKIHPYFQRLNNDANFVPAKRILTEICKFFTDIDGNFVEQFQSINGFDSRLWEIYLFCFLTEERFQIKRNNDRPDFIVRKFETEIAIEAVIVGRQKNNPPKHQNIVNIKTEIEIKQENKNNMPLRYGGVLFDKLKKKYWELSHVKGKPILFAVADFHDDMSMTWSFNAMIDYLYGLRYVHHYDKNGELVIKSEQIEPYTKSNGTKIEAGFFNQPFAENISGILFTSTGTISKFTRMGIQAGFRSKNQRVIREGFCYKHDPNASLPERFVYEVTEDCFENWGEGVNLFHNPNALIPIDKELFPSIAHHQLIDDFIVAKIPDFHPYFSYNYNIAPQDHNK